MVNLKKGQKVSLTKSNPGLAKIMVGLGWDTNKYDGGHDFDLDTGVFMIQEDGKVADSKDFIYYGNLTHSTESVKHFGDNLTGAGDGDDEVIEIDLTKVPDNVRKLVFTVAIYESDSRNQNFGMVENAFIRILDKANGSELLRYDLSEDYDSETALVVGELYRHNGEWKFKAVGSGYNGGFRTLLETYGA